MSRYRLRPSPAREQVLEHCGHARLVWNVAVEQGRHWRPKRKFAPGFAAQCRQLTEAREAFEWLAVGSVTVLRNPPVSYPNCVVLPSPSVTDSMRSAINGSEA